MARAYNFNAGPAALPLEVLQKAQEQLVDYNGIGMSVMEISHRSKEFEAINYAAQQLVSELLDIPYGYKVLFLQGGASTQFAMIPMNLLREGRVGAYVHTGSWAEKAYQEAKLFGEAVLAASGEDNNFTAIPDCNGLSLPDNAAYLHITSNETIGGIQFDAFPETGAVPLIADMSSDIMCRPIDVSQFSMIYAGAQKNLGPSGVTLVIMREELLEDLPKQLATMLRYGTHADNNSLYNTPPAYSVYMVKLVLEWLKEAGGLEQVERYNRNKTKLIYDVIDKSDGFYQGVAADASRSIMNITFRMRSEQLERLFIKESEHAGFVGLKGHRSVGGLRASTYNAVPEQSCWALSEFMLDFARRNG